MKIFWRITGLFVFLFSTCVFRLKAQKESIEAQIQLNSILNQAIDSNQIKALNNLGVQYELTDSAFADKAYRKALDLSRKLKNTKLECKSLTNLGILCKNYNNMVQAIHYQTLSYNVALKARLMLEAGKALSNLGNAQSNLKQFSTAIATYLKATTYLEKAGDQRALSLTLGNIAQLYNTQSEFHLGQKYAGKALEAGILCGNPNAIGSAFSILSYSLYKLNLLDSAYRQALRAIPYLKLAGNQTHLEAMYATAASYHLDKSKDLAQAKAYSDSSLAIARQLPDNYLAVALILAVSVAVEQGRLVEAEKLLEEVEPLASKSNLPLTRNSFENIAARFYKAKGNWKQAFMHKENQMKWLDSLNKNEEKQRTTDLEARYESAKKQVQIKQLKVDAQAKELSLQRRNYWIGGLSVGILVLGLIGFLLYLNARRKHEIARQTTEIQQQKIKELEQERQLLASHSMLKGQDEERSRLARDLHDGLGGMLSGLKFSLNNMKGNMILDEENASAFSRSIGQLDNVITEMRRVAHSMLPETLVRFGLKEATQDLCDQVSKSSGLKVHFQAIGMEGEFDKSVSVALYRIEQELLNNILKHAEATEITVQLVKDESQISLTVEDNGKGFDPSLIQQGAGLTSIRTRVEALGGRLDIQSKLGEGSSFLIEIS
jgi:two-component system NarL family sensor kinase